MRARMFVRLGVLVASTVLLGYSTVVQVHSQPTGYSPEGQGAGKPSEPPPPTPPATVPTVTPTVVPTPARCPSYELSFEHVVSEFRKTGRTWLDQRQVPELTCFTELYRTIVPSHNPSQRSESWHAVPYLLWAKLLEGVGSYPGADSDAVYQRNKQYIDCRRGWQSPRSDGHNATSMIGGGQRAGNKGRLTPGCQAGSVFLDANCKMQPIATVTRSAGGACMMSLVAEVASPLSLVWLPAYKEEASTLVRFRLNPNSDQNTWMWRASEALPLLVFDPDHTGVVSDGSQLFGSWAFGGKSTGKVGLKTAWRDGYEALATLDRNGDQKISGPELRDISVWFDKDRDAVSQPGEVKSALGLGVIALYFSADSTEDGSPIASKGYDRVVDGKRITGASIDWSEQAVMTQGALSTGGLAASEILDGLEEPVAVNASGSQRSLEQKILGRWIWRVDGPEGSTGFLAFSGAEEGLMGLTMSTLGIQGLEGVRAQLVFSHFTARVFKDSSNSTQVSFTVEGVSGALLKSSAQLSQDGETLTGKTVVEGTSLAKSGKYQYTWSARRLS